MQRARAVQISCRIVSQRLIAMLNVQGGKKSSSAIIDEFYTFDLMKIHVKNLSA